MARPSFRRPHVQLLPSGVQSLHFRVRGNPQPGELRCSIGRQRPSYGYRRVTAPLNRELSERVNPKRIYRA